jgi:large subunit ribosomal protein L15
VGSGHGKTSTRGGKGQTARNKVSPWFEGGQMPLQRRTPKRGFKNPASREYQVVNVGDLARADVSAITPAVLAAKGLVKSAARPIKVLGDGELAAALQVSAQAFSKSARDKIEAKGGTITWLDDAGNEKSAPKAKRAKPPRWGTESRKKVKVEKTAEEAKAKKGAKEGGKEGKGGAKPKAAGKAPSGKGKS